VIRQIALQETPVKNLLNQIFVLFSVNVSIYCYQMLLSEVTFTCVLPRPGGDEESIIN